MTVHNGILMHATHKIRVLWLTTNNYQGHTLTDDGSIFIVSTVVHPNPIVEAVRQSRLISKAVDIVKVDG